MVVVGWGQQVRQRPPRLPLCTSFFLPRMQNRFTLLPAPLSTTTIPPLAQLPQQVHR